jgi:hypothetical protein
VSMIDEGALSEALNEVANSFEISKNATDRILSEARTGAPPSRRFHAPDFVHQPGRGRTFLIAAVLVLVVGGITVPLFRSEGNPTKNAVTVRGAPPSTTIPGSAARPNTGVAGQTTLGAPTLSATGGQVTVTASGVTSATANLSPRIESNGSVDLKVARGHIELALSKLSSLVTGDGGYVDSTQANVGSRAPGNFSYATIVLQVPQRTFATLVSQVQRVGHTSSVSTSSNDVTSQYVDLKARITALEASRQQYLLIMTHARSISDILAVQNQLNNLQSQIEQLQGQLNVLNHQTTYGSLTVTLTEAGHPSNAPHHRSGLAKAWHDAVSGFVAGFEWLIRVSGPTLFALLMLGALWIIGRFGRRAYQRRRL